MALKTTAFERAAALGWSIAELAEKAEISEETLYKLRNGKRQPGRKAIEGLMRAFPSLTYRDLFMPSDRTLVQNRSLTVQPEQEDLAVTA